MRRYPSIGVLVLGLVGPWTTTLVAEEYEVRELAVPYRVDRRESVPVEVTTGRLPRGARLVLLTETGEILGAVAPFPPGARGGIPRTVPIPRSAVVDGRLRLRLQVEEPGALPRAPRPGEIERVRVPQCE